MYYVVHNTDWDNRANSNQWQIIINGQTANFYYKYLYWSKLSCPCNWNHVALNIFVVKAQELNKYYKTKKLTMACDMWETLYYTKFYKPDEIKSQK